MVYIRKNHQLIFFNPLSIASFLDTSLKKKKKNDYYSWILSQRA